MVHDLYRSPLTPRIQAWCRERLDAWHVTHETANSSRPASDARTGPGRDPRTKRSASTCPAQTSTPQRAPPCSRH